MVTSVYFKSDLLAAIKDLANKQDTTVSRLVRIALKEYLARQAEQK